MYNWKKISFEQILEDYDFMHKELDSYSRSTISDTVISVNCNTITLEECEQIVFLLKSSLSTVAIILRSQKAHELVTDVTTIEQARSYKDGPVFYTRYVTKMFYQSICDYLFNSERIKLLAFKNMTFSTDFHPICSGIGNNKSLKLLYFKSCDISDERCSKICVALRKSPVEVLGLENCNITSFGISWICWLLKEQSMIRTLAKWTPNKYQNEYFYRGEQGLKKLCLNDNPKIDDIGAKLLITTLYDDKWVIHVHLENCGMTNVSCKLLLNLSETTNVEVFDVMRNNITSTSTLALAIEKLSRNKSKVNRTLFKNNPIRNKQKNKAAVKTPMKHPSEISLSHSDSSCINSAENQRYSRIMIKSKKKSRKPFVAKNAYNVTEKMSASKDMKIQTNTLMNYLNKNEKKVNSKMKLHLPKTRPMSSVNNITLLQKTANSINNES